MKLNKKVIESAAILAFAGILTITAVTNSGITVVSTAVAENTTDETVLANTSLENEGTAGVTATLNDFQKAAAENIYTVEAVESEIVSATEDSETANVENVAEETEIIPEELTTEEKLQQDWADKLMAKVDEFLYVRAEADANADIVGKMYKGDRAVILEEGDEWTKIESGKVIGYVNNQYCVKGAEALEYAKKICECIATVNIDGLRVRTGKGEESKVVTKLASGEKLTIKKNEEIADGWVAVTYKGSTCFVSEEYVTISYKTGKAITKEAEDAAIAAEKAAKEKAAAEKAAKEKAAKEKAAKENAKKKTTNKGAVSASTDDVSLLAAIVYCEAGNCSYDQQLAVASVVMNRVRSKAYPNNIHDVIYQKGQFSPAKSGRLAKVLAKGTSSTAKKAAKAAIAGADNTDGAIGFRFKSSGKKGVVYGNVVFFK